MALVNKTMPWHALPTSKTVKVIGLVSSLCQNSFCKFKGYLNSKGIYPLN